MDIPSLILTLLFTFGNFRQGSGIAADAAGNIYVSDAASGKVVQLSLRGDSLRSVGGSGWNEAALDAPRGLAASFSNGVLAADFNNHRVQIFQRDMSYVSTLFKRDSDFEKERFGFPSDVALLRNGDILVCDTENKRIVQFSSNGEHRRTFGEFDAGAGRLKNPRQIALTPDDHIYVLDDERRIAHFDNFGNFISDIPDVFKTTVTSIFSGNDGIFAVSDSTLFFIKNSTEIHEARIPAQFTQQWQDGVFFKNNIYLLGKNQAFVFHIESILPSE